MNPHHSAPFRKQGNTATVATTAASSVATALARADDQTAVITNISATHAAVTFGPAGMAAADAGGYIIEPNGQRRVHLLASETHFRAIALNAGTGNVFVEVGDGSVT